MTAGEVQLPLLVALLAVLVALAGRAQGQCDYQQQVGVGEYYDIKSPNYPNNYPGGTQCRWRAYAASGNRLRLSCGIFSIPASQNCRDDRVRISPSGDVNLSDAHVYCGQGTFTVQSDSNMLNMVLESVYFSSGGRFLCNITAVQGGGGGCQCGIKKQSRIVGGTVTGVNEYPMMAGLVDSATRRIYCGATIISMHYALTAAHCLEGRDWDTVGLVVGEHDISTGAETSATRVYRLSGVVIHENYNQGGSVTQDNDIALVRVDGTIQFSPEVMPACLPFRYSNYDFTEQRVTVLGWGTTAFGGSMSNVLRAADLYLLSPGQCSAAYGTAVSTRQVCSYNPGKDACQSDSGGPLLWQDPTTGRLHLVAIVSHGIACATNNPGVNTRVTAYLNWIRSRASGDSFCTV